MSVGEGAQVFKNLKIEGIVVGDGSIHGKPPIHDQFSSFGNGKGSPLGYGNSAVALDAVTDDDVVRWQRNLIAGPCFGIVPGAMGNGSHRTCLDEAIGQDQCQYRGK